MKVTQAELEDHLKAFPKCEWICPHNLELEEEQSNDKDL